MGGKSNSGGKSDLSPFLKWAGGKRWFISNHKDLIPYKFNKYIEPFVGSGAVYFYLSPSNAILGDCNKELIETYRAIQKNWKQVWSYLQKHHERHSKEYYYLIRSNIPQDLSSRAARFIYLNRTCWNGLYRVNLQGRFNVPIGTRSTVIFENDSFEEISKVLQNAVLHPKDFEELIDLAEVDDLVFVDPPYTVRHNNNSFVKYNEKLFSWDDQKRLQKSLLRASNRGAKILGTNAYHDCIINLYKDSFQTLCVSRNSPISSKASSRKKFNELVIHNLKHNGKSG